MDRALLILDLDECLIWATETEPDHFDFRVPPYYVTKRPELHAFLESVFEWFEIAVWTSAGDDYASAVVSELFDDSARLRFIWTASRCTQTYDRVTREPRRLKDLRKVKRNGYALERVLMIDDDPDMLNRQYGNHLRVDPFKGGRDDRELVDVLPFLRWLKDQPNFRQIEKREWRSWRPEP